jgi:hypothetical protein
MAVIAINGWNQVAISFREKPRGYVSNVARNTAAGIE